jgi:hypothetical protein
VPKWPSVPGCTHLRSDAGRPGNGWNAVPSAGQHEVIALSWRSPTALVRGVVRPDKRRTDGVIRSFSAADPD